MFGNKQYNTVVKYFFTTITGHP